MITATWWRWRWWWMWWCVVIRLSPLADVLLDVKHLLQQSLSSLFWHREFQPVGSVVPG